jgi:hypothetical protein
LTLASPTEILARVLPPWHDSLKDVEGAQQQTMHRILRIHSETTFGVDHNLNSVEDLSSFRSRVPIRSFQDFERYLRAVSQGEYRALLGEPPVCWAMTRGTTGDPKMIPVTPTISEEVMVCGARSFLNHVYRTEDFSPLMGKTLNLFFPSRVGEVEGDPRMIPYGFSSGIFARYAMTFVKGESGRFGGNDGFGFVPSPEAVDAAATGLSREDWNRRFRVVYDSAKDEDVRILGGVVPVMHSFAAYLRRHYGIYPKDLWPNLKLLICSSVPNIQTRHAGRLRAMYGDASVVEVYGATEGVFAQQLDDQPFVTPNFDTYFFEVRAGRKVKMLHEMRPGQLGSLVISSSLFPRYEIGDVVECHGEHHYRIIGRRRWTVLTAHLARRIAQHILGLL